MLLEDGRRMNTSQHQTSWGDDYRVVLEVLIHSSVARRPTQIVNGISRRALNSDADARWYQDSRLDSA